ncbi:hypothetical protein [Nocardia terpenica]|uniref:hypothetical protein n=1 Tax=Nocardia terpenica TaxID=455432 RepID=UPI001EEAB86A|nr:hypothetical protein [Nocardia terpenica]
MCADCASLPLCDGCGLPAAEPHLTVDDGIRCPDCLTGWHRCESCDRYTDHTGTPTVDDGYVCDPCRRRGYRECADCGLLTIETRSLDNGNVVCLDCGADYSPCPGCGDLVSGDGRFCSWCRDDDADDRLHEYSYKPDPEFHGRGPLFLGMELEIKTPQVVFGDCVDLALDQLGDLAYLKEDGSIGCGFELVTHPMSYAWAMRRFPWPLLGQLHALGAYTDTGVGLHVHVSRAGFASPAHVFRWMKFFYRNQTHATTLARRDPDYWASFSPRARARVADFAKGERWAFGRTQAINVQPEHTFEVRIFASSLVPQQVQAALAFVAGSIEYTRHLTAGDIARRRGWEWPAFVAWIRSHPEYRPLLVEMEDLACAS